MFGLTPAGTIHTLVGLMALAAGFTSLLLAGRIAPTSRLGLVYIWTTVATCVTGFGIFEHGGFGPPHVLGTMTLLVLGFAAWPGGALLFGRGWAYITTVCYSLTLFFHLIPGVTETFTRIPAGQPLFTGPDDPRLQQLVALMFGIFLVGASLQVAWLWRADRRASALTRPAVLPTIRRRLLR